MKLFHSIGFSWPRFKESIYSHMLYILIGIGIAEICAYKFWTGGESIFNAPPEIFPGITAAWQWIYIMVGPTLFALFPMACVCLWSVWKLIAELRMSDDRILRKARECFGDNFQQLYYGQFNGINSFKSEKRLCQMLSRFSNNRREIVDRLFKRSGLHKPHWEKAMVAVPNGPSLAYKDFVLRISIDPKPPSALYFYLLDIIQNLAGTFGFAGTVLSLMATMGSMSVDMSQAEMINVLLQKSSAAFGSTAVGIFISVPAYIASKIFRRFFPQESDNKPGIEEQMLLDALVAQKFSTQQHMTQKEIIND